MGIFIQFGLRCKDPQLEYCKHFTGLIWIIFMKITHMDLNGHFYQNMCQKCHVYQSLLQKMKIWPFLKMPNFMVLLIKFYSRIFLAMATGTVVIA